MALEQYVNAVDVATPTTPQTTLSGSIDASVTSLTVASTPTGLTAPQFHCVIGSEILLVTGVSGTTWTVSRGQESTVAAAHSSGANIYVTLTRESFLRNPRSMSATGDLEYLASTGAPTRLAAGADGTYLRYASGVPTTSAPLMADLSGSSIVYGTDTTFGRGDAAGQMTLSAGASGTSLRLKNGSNAELGALYWNNDAFQLGTQGGVGAGTARDTILTSAAALILATEGTSRWTLDAATGHLRPWATATSDLGTASQVVRSAYLGKLGTLTSNGFVKTSGGDGTLSVDTTTYLTSVTAHNVLSATHGDTLAASVTRGDVIIGNSTPKWARLAIGSASRYLSSDGTDVSWGQVSLTAGVTGTLPVANGGTGVTASTGSVAVVLSTSPTLVTPVLGVATCTSLNGNTFTAGSYTLTGAASKVLTFSNSLTLAGTDSTTMTFPSTSATIARTDAANSFSGAQTITPGGSVTALTITGATETTSQPLLSLTQTWNASGVSFKGIIATITNTASASGARVLELVTGSTSEFSVDVSGNVVCNGNLTASNGVISGFNTAATGHLRFASGVNFDLTAAAAIVANMPIAFHASSAAAGSWDVSIRRAAAAVLQLGDDLNGAAISQTLQACNGITGTDKTGGNLTLASGKGTGAGAVSSLIFQTPTVLASGTTAQSLATRLTISSAGLTIADATDIVLNATTGTKIGTATTQKLGFYGATPITCAVLATGASATVDNVITALQNLGLVKQS